LIETRSRKKPAEEKRRYHHGDLRAALIAAALKLIEERGVKGFSLKDAAAMTGVSIAAPYRHFPDKEALLQAIRDEGFAEFDATLDEASQRENTPKARIVELGMAYVRFALQRPAHFRVMFGLSGRSANGEIAKRGGPRTDGVMTPGEKGFHLLVRAVAELYPEAAQLRQMDRVVMSWSLVHGFALLQLEDAFADTVGGDIPEAQLRRVLELMLEG